MNFLKKISLIAFLAMSTTSVLWAQTETEDAPADAAETTEAPQPAEPASVEDLSKTVATVNGDPITLGEILVLKKDMPADYLQGDDAAKLQSLVDQIAVQKVLADKTADTPVLLLQIDNNIRTTKANETLKTHVDENLNDEYLQSTYDELIGNQPDTTEWNAQHILVATEDEAKDVKKRVEDGEDFTEVAKEVSTGPSGPQGGDLGWFGPGQMVPEFETVVKDLEKGDVSDPVQTQFGWHIIKLNDTRVAPKPSFEDVKPQLQDYASSKLIDEYITSLRDETEIQIEDGVDASEINKVLPE